MNNYAELASASVAALKWYAADNRKLFAVSSLTPALESTGEWRSRKATEYTSDARNWEAQNVCVALSKLSDISDGAARRYYDAFHGDDYGYAATGRQSEVMRGIGFHSDYETLDELVDAIVPGGE